jgi:hypothetical protein
MTPPRAQSPEPLEPLYTLRVAATLIPVTTLSNLYSYLSRHADQFPPRYQRLRRGYTRLLTQSECARIREDLVKSLPSRHAPSACPSGKTPRK